jgi:hypothetical protein
MLLRTAAGVSRVRSASTVLERIWKGEVEVVE